MQVHSQMLPLLCTALPSAGGSMKHDHQCAQTAAHAYLLVPWASFSPGSGAGCFMRAWSHTAYAWFKASILLLESYCGLLTSRENKNLCIYACLFTTSMHKHLSLIEPHVTPKSCCIGSCPFQSSACVQKAAAGAAHIKRPMNVQLAMHIWQHDPAVAQPQAGRILVASASTIHPEFQALKPYGAGHDARSLLTLHQAKGAGYAISQPEELDTALQVALKTGDCVS